jgi:hypothetical protein
LLFPGALLEDPVRRLLPKRGASFDLQGLAGYSIECKHDPSGKTAEAAFYTPALVSGYKSKRISWLGLSSNSD